MPIIFLSARDTDFDIVAGLRLGADDYLTKDVEPAAPCSRASPRCSAAATCWRRRRRPRTSSSAAPLTLDVKRLTAHWAGRRVDLTLTEFWMVHALARFPGHVKDRDS